MRKAVANIDFIIMTLVSSSDVNRMQTAKRGIARL